MTRTSRAGPGSTTGTGWPGQRAGQLDRRLVRHLPARPAARLPDPAGGGPPARLTIGPWTHLSTGRHGVDAGDPRASGWRMPAARTPPERAPVRLLRDGRGSLARLRVLAAARLPATAASTSSPAAAWPARRPAAPTGARTGTATTRPTRPRRPAGCGMTGATAGRVDNTSPGGARRTCSPTPPPALERTPRSSARSAPRSGSAPACRTPTCSSGSATSTRAAAPATSATA